MNGFIRMSRYAGMREDLVQAGGGNSSYKESDDRMLIKASGYQLSELSKETGYSIVDHVLIRNAFMNDMDGMDERQTKELLEGALIEGKRPSIETFLHAATGRYTLHTHPIVVNVLTCRKGGNEELRKLFPGALMVPYATPGADLAKAYFRAYQQALDEGNGDPDIIFLRNHGLIVSGDSADEVIRKTEEVTRKIEEHLGIDMSDYHVMTKLWECLDDGIVWRVTDEHVMKAYEKMGHLWEHAICPDCVVFLGRRMLDLGDDISKERIEEHMRVYGPISVIALKGHLYIVAENVKKAMEIQSVLSFSAQVAMMNEGHDCDVLSDEEQDFLLDWDAERYRKEMK